MAETRSSSSLLTYLRARRGVLVYGLALAVLTALPYALAWQVAGDAWRFSGFLIGVEDGNSYIAKMLLGGQGLWLFRPPYTTWQVAPLPLFLPYLALGKLAAGPALHLQLVVLYHLARLAAVVLVVLATFDFASLFLESPRARLWATMLATLGGGLGIWGMALGVKFGWGGALCCYSPEAFGFLESLFLFHNTLAHALLLWLLTLLLRPTPPRWAPLLALLLGVSQPLLLVVAAAALGALAALALLARRWDGARVDWLPTPPFWLALLTLLLLGGLYAWLEHTSLYAQVWARQSQAVPEGAQPYLWAYAWLWPGAILGAWAHRSRLRAMWLVAWGLAFPLLVLLPVTDSRRLVEGGWTALAVLTAWGLARLPVRPRRALGVAILTLALTPAATLMFRLTQTALHPRAPAFVPAAEAMAFEHLAAAAQDGDGVLAAYPTGNALPAWAPVRVIAGLGPESPFLERQKRAIARFFDPATSDAWREQFLQRNRLRWVFWGPAEKALGRWNPARAAFLCPRYRRKGYAFFEVCP